MIKKNLKNMLVSEAVLPRISYNWKKKSIYEKTLYSMQFD